MISQKEFHSIKEKIFELTDFHFNGEIIIKKFDGAKVEYDGKNAGIGCKDKATLAKALFLLSINASAGAFRIIMKV